MIVTRARIVAAAAVLVTSVGLAVVGGTGASANTPSSGGSAFSDVPTSSPFYADITYLVDQKIATGYPDGTFRPAASITRQAVAAFLYRYEHSNTTAPSCTSAPFSDVPTSSPFCPEIAALKTEGVLGGFSDGSFRPTGVVTRQALASFLFEIANSGKAAPACMTAAFSDVPATGQFCGVISALTSSKVINGYSDRTFKPTTDVSRQATAAFLHRASEAPTPTSTTPATPATSPTTGSTPPQPATNTIIPKPDTTTVTPTELASVTGDPNGAQEVTLSKGAPSVRPGGYLVSSPTPSAPQGLLAKVTRVTRNANGSLTVSTEPATLDEAYSTFQAHASTDLTPDDVSIVPQVTNQVRRATVRRAAAGAPGFKVSSTPADFSCKGSSTAAITLTADLTKIHVSLDLDANPSYPSINFLMTAYPVFSINFGFSGEMTCSLDGSIKATIPIPAAPALDVTVKPIFTLHGEGHVDANFSWSPRMVVGFQRAPGIKTNTHTFGSSAGVNVTGSAGADAYLGVSIGLELAGRAGVTGDAGPEISADYSTADQCINVNADIEVNLKAEADVFVRHWEFDLFSGRFDKVQVYHHCFGSDGGGSGGGGGSAGSGSKPLTFTLSKTSGPAGTYVSARSLSPCPLTNSGLPLSGVSVLTQYDGNEVPPGTDTRVAFGTPGMPANSDGSWTTPSVPIGSIIAHGSGLYSGPFEVQPFCVYQYTALAYTVDTFQASAPLQVNVSSATVHANSKLTVYEQNACPAGSTLAYGQLSTINTVDGGLGQVTVNRLGNWSPLHLRVPDNFVPGTNLDLQAYCANGPQTLLIYQGLTLHYS